MSQRSPFRRKMAFADSETSVQGLRSLLNVLFDVNGLRTTY